MKRALVVTACIGMMGTVVSGCPNDDCPVEEDGYGISMADGVVFVDGVSGDAGSVDADEGIEWLSDQCYAYEADGFEPIGQPCDGPNLCRQYSCQVGSDGYGLCTEEPETEKQCYSNNLCMEANCHPGTGECIEKPREHGSACDNICFTNTFVCDTKSGEPECISGTCAPGTGVGDCVIVEEDLNPIDCSGASKKVVCNEPEECACIDHMVCNPESGLCDKPIYKDEQQSCDADENVCTLEKCVSSGGGAPMCEQTGDLLDCSKHDSWCFSWSCVEKAGCKQTSFIEGVACNDGNHCTDNDVCVPAGFMGLSGGCEGSAISADDGNPCTADTCNPVTGQFEHSLLTGSECDDGKQCTINDTCLEGMCTGGVPKTCDDGNICTTDQCVEGLAGGGCVNFANNNSCDDNSACTENDTCVEEICKGDLKQCNDNDACNGVETCDAGIGCILGVPLFCNDGDACTDDFCLPSIGCVNGPNDIPCDDNSACTQGDKCGLNGCKGSPIECVDNDVCNGIEACTDEEGCVLLEPAKMCDDGKPCTLDICDPVEGCVFEFAPGDCNDGDACTISDTCQPDGNCYGAPKPCSDGTVCNGIEGCDPMIGCVLVEAAPVCDDNNPCTDDFCVPDTGCDYINNNQFCDDGDACTLTDQCGDGVCEGKELNCDDDDVCNGEFECDPATGCYIAEQPLGDCNDNNPCTTDSCNPTLGCINDFNTAPCNDDKPCTENDKCTVGVCTGTQKDCEDGNICNGLMACEPGVGCKLTVPPPQCDDGNVCTTDSCDAVAGCQYTHNTVICEDGNGCTIGDVCSEGACQPGQPVVCNDGKECTADTCNPQTGDCEYPALINVECDDGNQCTLLDLCNEVGGCSGSQPPVCDDGDFCTVDFCDPQVGCQAAQKPCDDGNPCTIGVCSELNGECIQALKDPGTSCDSENSNLMCNALGQCVDTGG